MGVTILSDCVLTLSQCIPQLDGLVSGSRHDLPVISGEGDGKDILGMVLETTGGLTGIQVPESQGLIPGAGKSVMALGGHHHICHEVTVAVETTFRDAIATFLAFEVPKNEGLVPRR